MTEIPIKKDEILNPGRNTCIRCLCGTVWITWFGGDTILRAGDRLDLRGMKKPLVQALAASRIGLDRSERYSRTDSMGNRLTEKLRGETV